MEDLYLTAWRLTVSVYLQVAGISEFITYLTGGHHHAATDGVKGVRGDTGTSGDGPSEEERGKEVTLKRAGKDDGLDGVVHAEVETTVDNDTGDGGHEATVETGNTVRGEGLLVDVHQAVELTLTTRLGVLGVVGKTSTGVVEGVDEEEGSGTSGTTRGKVAGHPPPVAVTLLLEGEHGLVGVAESEVEGLGREVTDDVGGVATPEGGGALLSDDTLEALANAGVGLGETARAEHLILFDVVRWCLMVTRPGSHVMLASEAMHMRLDGQIGGED